MPEPSAVQSPTLFDALEAHGGSIREIAEEAGVSFRGITEARNGFDPKVLRSKRKQYGVAESMTRLSTFLGVDPGTVLSELGLDPTDGAIRRHMKRAMADAPSAAAGDDYVLQRVRAREVLGSPRSVHGPLVGIIGWRPFFDGQVSGRSVAERLLRSLLGSIDPEWDRGSNFLPYDDFSRAERDLLSDSQGTPEILAGLYDLPWRQGEGISVVPFPGLHVELAGLSSTKLEWRDILTYGRSAPAALVVEGDAGSHLLNGAADYPRERLISPAIGTFDPARIAERIRREMERENAHPSGFVFIADGPLVSAVKSHLQEQGLDLHELGDPGWAPSYQVGIGLRLDADRFGELIQEAFEQDLFGRVLPRTVQTYIDLLEGAPDRRIRLRLHELEDVSTGLADRFVAMACALKPTQGLSPEEALNATRAWLEGNSIRHAPGSQPAGA